MVKTSRRYVSGEEAKRLKEVIESTHNKQSSFQPYTKDEIHQITNELRRISKTKCLP